MSQLTYSRLLDGIKKDNLVSRMRKEIEDTRTNDERKKALNTILEKILLDNPEYIKNQQKMDEHVELMKNVQYQTLWYKLNDEQKLNRLYVFFEDKKITDKELKEDIIKRVITEKLQGKYINYDKAKYRIIDINILKRNDEGDYELTEIKKKNSGSKQNKKENKKDEVKKESKKENKKDEVKKETKKKENKTTKKQDKSKK